MSGTPEQRETSALGMGDLIELTSSQALGPFVIKITGTATLRFLFNLLRPYVACAGPLIRIIGDRFPSRVKLAILLTLSYVHIISFPLNRILVLLDSLIYVYLGCC